MVESEGGRLSRPDDDDEFEEAFGVLTASAATTVREFEVGPATRVPGTQASAAVVARSEEAVGPSTPQPSPSEPAPAVAESPPTDPPSREPLPQEPPPPEPPAQEPPATEPPAPVLPSDSEQAAGLEAPSEFPAEGRPESEHDAPDGEQPSQGADGTEGMNSVFGAVRPVGTRASTRPMEEGLRYLFAPLDAPTVPVAGHESTSESGHSSYFQEFVRTAALRRQIMSSGDRRLDDLLGGGLHPGLYLLSGSGARTQRAFLDNLMWGAVEQKHPVRYCAFDTGVQAVWERMIVALGSLIGELVLPEDLRVSTGDDDVSDRVRAIDAMLVRNVLPYVQLRDSVGSDEKVSPSRFLAALDGWLIREGAPRLLIIDSFCGLDGLVAGEEEPRDRAELAGELDRLLKERSSVAMAATTAEPEAGLSGVGRGRLLLGELDRGSDETTEWVAVTVHNARGVRSEVFAVDKITGLFG